MKEQNCPPPGVLATSHEVLHDEHAMPFDELKALRYAQLFLELEIKNNRTPRERMMLAAEFRVRNKRVPGRDAGDTSPAHLQDVVRGPADRAFPCGAIHPTPA